MSKNRLKTKYIEEAAWGTTETKTLYAVHNNSCDIVSFYNEDGDFSHLSTDNMLKAKQYGTPTQPIFEHALVHGFLTLLACVLFTFDLALSLQVATIITILHFLIDLGKGKITYYFKMFRCNTKRPYWYLFGLDQLLHIASLHWMYTEVINTL